MDVPEWVIRATRSMPPGALRVMAEMYAHGELVKDTAGRQFVHWQGSLRQLPNVPVSTVSRVLPMLLEEECLVEHPGTRIAAGRLWSTYSAPVAEPVSRTALEELRFPFAPSSSLYREGARPKMEHAPEPVGVVHTMEHAPDFVTSAIESGEGVAPGAIESEEEGGACSILEHAPEAPPTRPRTRGHEHHQQQATGRSSSSTRVPSPDTTANGLSSRQPSAPAGSQDEIAELCLTGLRAIGVGRPENVMRQFPLNSVAAALEQLVMKLSRGEEVTGKGAAYVMWLLVNRLDFAPVEDFGFLAYFVPSESPKVVNFAARRPR